MATEAGTGKNRCVLADPTIWTEGGAEDDLSLKYNLSSVSCVATWPDVPQANQCGPLAADGVTIDTAKKPTSDDCTGDYNSLCCFVTPTDATKNPVCLTGDKTRTTAAATGVSYLNGIYGTNIGTPVCTITTPALPTANQCGPQTKDNKVDTTKTPAKLADCSDKNNLCCFVTPAGSTLKDICIIGNKTGSNSTETVTALKAKYSTNINKVECSGKWMSASVIFGFALFLVALF